MENWKKTSTTSQRLSEAMKSAHMKQADLARATGLSKGGISNYVLGRYEPKSDIISKLAVALNCSEMWLMGYDVPMRRPCKKEYTYDKENACCSEEENPLLLKIYEYLETFSQDQLEAELAHLKDLDEGKKNCNHTRSAVADLSQREIQVVRSYREQNDAIKNAIDKILDLEFLE